MLVSSKVKDGLTDHLEVYMSCVRGEPKMGFSGSGLSER